MHCVAARRIAGVGQLDFARRGWVSRLHSGCDFISQAVGNWAILRSAAAESDAGSRIAASTLDLLPLNFGVRASCLSRPLAWGNPEPGDAVSDNGGVEITETSEASQVALFRTRPVTPCVAFSVGG